VFISHASGMGEFYTVIVFTRQCKAEVYTLIFCAFTLHISGGSV
jgi:hypothetical protein